MNEVRIPGALQSQLQRLDGASAAALLQRLRPGDTLKAEVLAALGKGQWRLAVANTELLARAKIPLQAGDRLTLLVEKGLPEPLLKILPRKQYQRATEVLARHALSRQQPPAEIQRQLRQLPTKGQTETISAQEAFRLLKQTGFPAQRLEPAMVRRALQESGLFLEARLGAALPPLPGDRKLQLLRLLQQLAPENRTPAPPAKDTTPGETRQSGDALLNRLRQLVEASVARIQHHQTSSLGQEEPNRTLWQFDLPLQFGDRQEALPLRILREQPAEDDTAASTTWKVDVHFDFADLGPVSARITLKGDQVSCAFRSEKHGTAQRFETALPRLADKLQQMGLGVGAVTSLRGGLTDVNTRPPDGLVDEKA